MSTFLLIRHALCNHVGKSLAGRSLDVHLNLAGIAQAQELAEQLDPVRIDAIVSSPLPRARETAAPLLARRNLELCIDDRLTEIDYGKWTGASIEDLRPQEAWVRFNTLRSVARVPGGEQMLDVQARAVAALESLRVSSPDGCYALFSHGDAIRALVAHCAGIPLDLFQRLEIGPASVSIVVVTESGIAVRCVNVPVQGIGAII